LDIARLGFLRNRCTYSFLSVSERCKHGAAIQSIKGNSLLVGLADQPSIGSMKATFQIWVNAVAARLQNKAAD